MTVNAVHRHNNRTTFNSVKNSSAVSKICNICSVKEPEPLPRFWEFWIGTSFYPLFGADGDVSVVAGNGELTDQTYSKIRNLKRQDDSTHPGTVLKKNGQIAVDSLVKLKGPTPETSRNGLTEQENFQMGIMVHRERFKIKVFLLDQRLRGIIPSYYVTHNPSDYNNLSTIAKEIVEIDGAGACKQQSR